MENCSICGQPTRFQVEGRSVCALCDSDERWARVEMLREKVKASRNEHRKLSDEFDRLNREVVQGTHGIPYPDSTHRIVALGDQTRAAFQKYERAMELYVEAVKRS